MWKEASWLGVPRAEIEEKQIYQGNQCHTKQQMTFYVCLVIVL